MSLRNEHGLNPRPLSVAQAAVRPSPWPRRRGRGDFFRGW